MQTSVGGTKPSAHVVTSRQKPTNDKRLVAISELVLDRHFHRTAPMELLRHLAKRGFEVELCATRSKEQYSTGDLKVYCIPLRFAPPLHLIFYSVIMFLFLPIYVLLKKPRFIMTDQGPWILAFLWTPVLARCLKVKVILDIRSTPVEIVGWQMGVKNLFYKISILIAKKMFDGITAATDLMREEIAKSFQMGINEIGVWTNGASTQLFDPAKYAAEGDLLRRMCGLTNAFIVLYHGAVTRNRGLVESARSLEMLEKDGYDDVVLFVLGAGPALPALKRAAQERDLDGKVVIHDPVHFNEVPKYIAMADVGLIPLPNHPDWIHQCPLNLLEYLAMEKPVIVTDIPCNRWIVGENKCGTYVKDADPKEFAKAISLLHDDTTLKQRGVQGRSIVEQRFDWDKIAESFENYLLSL